MISREQAREKVIEHTNRNFQRPDDEFVVIDEETITKDYGWLFFLINKKYLETQNISDMSVGLGPILFVKQSQNIIPFGSALSGEQCLEQYEKQSANKVKVVFTDFEYGMQKVSFTKLLRYEANLSLSEAKKITDDLIEGKTIIVKLETQEAARNICEKAKVLGVVCEISE